MIGRSIALVFIVAVGAVMLVTAGMRVYRAMQATGNSRAMESAAVAIGGSDQLIASLLRPVELPSPAP